MDAEGISTGRWPLLAPWLHTSALPVFAVLSVVVAVVYRAVEQWLAEYETFAHETARRAARVGATLPTPRATLADLVAPRRPLRARVRSSPASRRSRSTSSLNSNRGGCCERRARL
jgi:hypothetical protein